MTRKLKSEGGGLGGGGGENGMLLPAPLMAAAGPEPPRGGGSVIGGGGGFGGAVNTQAAYHNREKARDALYAQLRTLAGRGGASNACHVADTSIELRMCEVIGILCCYDPMIP
jgi:hypothetical protein